MNKFQKILLTHSGMAALLCALICIPPQALSQSQRVVGDDGMLDDAWDVIVGEYGYNRGMQIAIGGTYASNAASSFRSNPPNAYVTYTDVCGGLQRTDMYDVELWDRGAGIVELSDGSGVVWTSGAINPYNGSYDIIVVYQQFGGAAPTYPVMRFFGGNLDEGASSIIELNDGSGDILVAGTTESYANQTKDGIVMRIDPHTMNIVWTRRIANASSDINDEIFAIKQAKPDFANPTHVFAVGTSNTNSLSPGVRDYDMWIVKFDPNAVSPSVIDARNFGGSENDCAYGVETYTYSSGGTTQSRVAVVGDSYSFTPEKNDAVVVNFDENFGTPWAGSYDFGGHSPHGWDAAYDVIQKPDLTPSSDIVVVGQSNPVSFDLGIGFGFELPAGGGLPTSSFSYLYGESVSYSNLKSLTFTQNLMTPYLTVGRNDFYDAGDQYLVDLTALGQSGGIGGAPCEVPMVPSVINISPVPLRIIVPRMDALVISEQYVPLNTFTIGRLIDVCSP